MKTYNAPTQVLFHSDIDTENPVLVGIAYGNEIICADCGGIFELPECVVLQELKWLDFSEYIR